VSRVQAAFFFGSGISIPSGLPSTYQITEAVFNEDWHLDSQGIFWPGANSNPYIPDNVTPLVRDFLHVVYDRAADYLAELSTSTSGRRPHYEDLFSLAEQASRPETDHVPNLAAVEFVRRLRRDTAHLHSGFKANAGEGFVGLATAACDLLHWIVHHKLSRHDKDRRGLELVSRVASIATLDVFTLNHDLLIEAQLKSDGLGDIEMGFTDRTHGQFAVYQPGWWRNPKRNTRLFKLHGSLNWWLYDFPGWARQYAMPQGIDAFHSKDQNGRFVHPFEPKAAFLSGTIVKELRYGLGFWDELFSAFRDHLANHTHLICCGYGFGDTGVNQRLDQWMRYRLDKSNRLVILTPESPDRYLSDKPYWLVHLWEEERVVFVPNYLEQCTLNNLMEYFDPLNSD
jgi:SIR2-like protein